jgi:hypothetical protein
VKGLRALPLTDDLLRAYRELEGALVIAEDRLALLSQWARLDPRLAELLTGYLLRHWVQLNVMALVKALESQPWPRAILVLLRFAELSVEGKVERVVLRGCVDSIERAFPEKSNDLFFIPLQRMNRVVLAEAIDYQGMPYIRSGFVGSVSLLAKGRIPEGVTALDMRARERVLGEMAASLRRGETISVDDYMRRCRGLISRRQAQRDLARSPLLVASGFTRNHRYRARG